MRGPPGLYRAGSFQTGGLHALPANDAGPETSEVYVAELDADWNVSRELRQTCALKPRGCANCCWIGQPQRAEKPVILIAVQVPGRVAPVSHNRDQT